MGRTLFSPSRERVPCRVLGSVNTTINNGRSQRGADKEAAGNVSFMALYHTTTLDTSEFSSPLSGLFVGYRWRVRKVPISSD